MKNFYFDEKSAWNEYFGLIFSGFRINKRIHTQREGSGGDSVGARKGDLAWLMSLVNIIKDVCLHSTFWLDFFWISHQLASTLTLRLLICSRFYCFNGKNWLICYWKLVDFTVFGLKMSHSLKQKNRNYWYFCKKDESSFFFWKNCRFLTISD